MKLSDAVIGAVKGAGVTVYFANRSTTKAWNEIRGDGDPCRFGGWYWYRTQKGRVTQTDDTDVPFRTQSAAIRDAYVKLQLRHQP